MPAFAAWRRVVVAVPLFLVLALAVTLFAAAPADAMSQRERKIRHGVAIALHQKGDPYRYGAAGPNAFDCSGLTMFSFRRAGLSLPRTSAAQYRYVRHVNKGNLRRGDLMFFHSGGHVYHVAIFLFRKHGRVHLLHASRPGRPVQVDPVWTRSWWAGTLRHHR